VLSGLAGPAPVRGVPGDALLAWAERTGRRQAAQPGRGALRFAFYGRVSTEDYQDPVTSLARQQDQAQALVSGHGQIVARFFDVGQSRMLAWARRPQAAALVAELADPGRGWDAVVIGEYERAFYGGQYASMAPLFEHYGIQLWTPEVGGRIDFGAEDHEQTMMALGLQSKREITRTRIRVRTAMAAQTREQGRYLGGGPPYGYQLADAGPHPNRAHAAWGRRAHRLAPDPQAAPQVAWIFAQRLAGHSMARIARALNDAGIPCPSAADPERNPHRSGEAWTLHTVRAILANPRYTGRQVWNWQRTDQDLVDPANTGLGHRPVQRWNLPEGWVISARPAHPAIVSEADYIAAQDLSARRGPGSPADRCYRLAGLLAAASAGGSWSPAGPTARRPTGAATATPAPPARTQPAQRTLTSAKPRSCPASPPGHPPARPGPGSRAQGQGKARSAVPAGAAAVIAYLLVRSITLTYHPDECTLRASTQDAAAITVDRKRADSTGRS
jgi:site-specific DNA recombinase